MSVSQPVDSSILHEIVRIIESRRKVPDKVVVKSREYLLTYLEDHQRRMEEALMRYDADRLNMLYGQLASKIKYQLLRRLPARASEAMGLGGSKAKAAGGKAAAPATASRPSKAEKTSARKPAASRTRPARKTAATKRPKKTTATKRTAARKPGRATKKAAKRRR